jgi:hypothetical protein
MIVITYKFSASDRGMDPEELESEPTISFALLTALSQSSTGISLPLCDALNLLFLETQFVV